MGSVTVSTCACKQQLPGEYFNAPDMMAGLLYGY